MSFLAKCKTVKQQIYAYERLHRFLILNKCFYRLNNDENKTQIRRIGANFQEVFESLKKYAVLSEEFFIKPAEFAVNLKARLLQTNLFLRRVSACINDAE